jgi:hypothetical protein
MSDPLSNPGGRVNFDTNERAVSADFDRVGTMALQSITTILAWMFRDLVDDQPISGFPGPDDCKVSLSAAPLTIQVRKGIGLYYDSAETDAFGMHYKPIVVGANFTEVLSAHDATNPRYDLICLAPSTTDDQPSSRLVLNTGTTSINKRTRLSYEFQVVEGTPAASPSVPATPAGYIAIARVLVPATSGTVTIYDVRPILSRGHGWAPDPASEYVDDGGFVPGSGGELLVTESSVPSLTLQVAAGDVVVKHSKGPRRLRIPATTVVHGAAHATLDRIDTVVVEADGLVSAQQGTPDANPVAPSLGLGMTPIADVYIAALDTSLVNANITDRRVREPFGVEQIRDEAVTAAKMAVKHVTPVVTGIGTSVSETATITMVDEEGNVVEREQLFMAELMDTNADLALGGTGALVASLGDHKKIFRTAATGIAEVDISGQSVGTNRMIVTPMSENALDPTPGSPTYDNWTTS